MMYCRGPRPAGVNTITHDDGRSDGAEAQKRFEEQRIGIGWVLDHLERRESEPATMSCFTWVQI